MTSRAHSPSRVATPPKSGSTSSLTVETTASSSSNGMAADSNNNNHNNNMASFKLILLVLMVLQNSSTVLVGRYTRSGSVPKEEQYDVNHLILVIELGKLLLSCALEFYSTSGHFVASVHQHIWQRPMDALKILVPALLYLVQNTLLYVALSNLTAPIFQVTYQAKLVTTALVSVFMLQRSYSVQQWICLVLLSLGVAIVVLGEKSKSTTTPSASQNLVLGLTAVSIACFSSALAGVYFEKVLKKPGGNHADATKAPPASLWMRNIQLSAFSIMIAFVRGLFKEPDSDLPANASYLHGFSAWAWVLVVLQAGGGLLVAAVIKYADNVLKGLATGVSVVFATLLSMVFFDTPLTGQFSVGAVLILGAVYFFSNPLPPGILSPLKSGGGTAGSNGMKKTEDDVELKNLLPK